MNTEVQICYKVYCLKHTFHTPKYIQLYIYINILRFTLFIC